MASSLRLLIPRTCMRLSTFSPACRQLQSSSIALRLPPHSQPAPFRGAIRKLTSSALCRPRQPQFAPSKILQQRRSLHKLSSAEQNPTPKNYFSSRRSSSSTVTTDTAATNVHEGEEEVVQSKTMPDVSSKPVAYWLLGSAGLVFCIVVVGGLTRLTESGLSITQWKPITGTIPPLSEKEWEEEFSLYRSSPEFRLLNPYMNLEQYKSIYYMEWGHRILGRLIGIAFVVPAIAFTMRRRVSKSDAYKLSAIAIGIGIQGIIGWWMVKSGLGGVENFDETGGQPRVSQYRLAAHLGAAFAVYAGMVHTALSILRDQRFLSSSNSNNNIHTEIIRRSTPAMGKIRIAVGALTLLVFATAMTGALVAGLDAGLVYNEFPTMAGGDVSNPWRIVPPSEELFNASLYGPTWRNMLENPVTVQLQHRIMATTTFFSVVGLWAYTRLANDVKAELNKPVRSGVRGLVHVAILQVALGISTLVYMVPTEIAAAHQAGSLALFTMCLVLGSRVWLPRALIKVIARQGSKTNTTMASGFVKV